MRPDLRALAGRPVIIGAGVAGLMVALRLAPKPVVLLSKGLLGTGSSSAPGRKGALKNFALKQRTNLNKMAAINFFSFPAITNLNCSYDRRRKKDHSCYQSHDSYSPFY
jgi:flavin-dependent dehydrogenase